jgi:hypothetical protein
VSFSGVSHVKLGLRVSRLIRCNVIGLRSFVFVEHIIERLVEGSLLVVGDWRNLIEIPG